MLGKVLSHYEIVAKLGEGGMGTVWKARDTLLQRDVALKLLPEDKTGDPERRRRFLREARAASALNHPNIITIHGVVQEDELDCIVMELVDGEPLGRLIPEGGLPQAKALTWGLQIARAVAVAHEHGIVHRDLKPGNVMITSSGAVKVLDFGLAKREVEADPDVATLTQMAPLTQVGAVLGTIDYMSPEQALGKPADARSDVFSFGVVLYEMLTGRRPFHGTSAASLLHAVAYEPARPALEVRGDVAAGVASILDRALAKAPGERFASMDELAGALEEAIHGGREMSEAPTPPAGSVAPEPTEESRPRSSILETVSRVSRSVPGKRPLVTVGVALLLVAAIALASIPKARRGVAAIFDQDPRPTVTSGVDLSELSAEELIRTSGELLLRFDLEGNVETAIQALRRAIAQKPDSAPAHALLARALRRQHIDSPDPQTLEQALANAQRAMDLDPHLSASRLSLALVEQTRGNEDRAEEILGEVLKLDPGNARAHQALGDLATGRGELDAAEQAFRRALELEPANPQLHSRLGAALYRLGRFEEAEAAFREGIEAAPDFFFNHKNLGAALHMQGRYAEAARALQQALEIRAEPSIYNNLGTLYFFQGLYPQAVSAFEKALELGANDYTHWANLADAYRWTAGNEDKARDSYRRAIQLLRRQLEAEPESVTLRTRLALYLAKRGDLEDAVAEVEAVEPAAAEDPRALYRLATAMEVAGDRQEAVALLERALRAGYSKSEFERDPELQALRGDPESHMMLAELESSEP